MQQVLSYFTFTPVEIAVLSCFFLFLLVQVFFYVRYYRIPLAYAKAEEINPSDHVSNNPSVSVIISSENEVEVLRQNLPYILDQDYPNFEVIVINNGSTDETYELLESLKLQYPNLYHTYVPISYDLSFGRRKLAFTLGVKAAKGDVLLFTEPYSRPLSNQWIRLMTRDISDQIEVVLGYSFYTKAKEFYNRVARFNNHLFSMQYLAQAIKGKPFTGVYRNVAYKKHLFFDNKGFSSFLNLENAEDVFINQIVTPHNTAVAISQDSFVETTIGSFSFWRRLKKSYSVAKMFFKTGIASAFSFESFSRFVFYALFLLLTAYAAYMQHWALLGISVLIFLIHLIMQLLIINKSAKYFNSGKFYFSLIVMDIFQPIYNVRFRTRHRMKKGR